MRTIVSPRRLLAVLLTLALAGLYDLGAAIGAGAAAGDLDAGYGTGGKVTTDFGDVDAIAATVVQPDGKLVAAGGVGESGFALARYNPDGSLDVTFGGGGRVVTPVGGHIQVAYALALCPDGKLVAAGNRGDDFATVRYNADGSLDPTFGSGGEVVTVFGGWGGARAVAVQPDGRAVVAGIAGGPDNWHAVMARYRDDGSLDPTFGSGGRVASAVGGSELAILGTGKILSVGQTGGSDFGVARFNNDGSADTGFGVGGVVTADLTNGYDEADTIAVQPDGRIVVAGRTDGGSTVDFGVVRLLADGALDPSFGSGGKVVTDFAGTDDAEGGVGIVVQPDGRIVVLGCTGCYSAGNFALARYNADGTLDATFGAGGKVSTDFAGGEDRAGALALQADGSLIAAGRAQVPGHSFDFALARYSAAGVPAAPVYAVGTNTRISVGNSSVGSVVGAAGVPAGDTVTVSVATGTFAGAVGCSDSKGNTYAVVADRKSGQGRLFVCAGRADTVLVAGDIVTATYPAFGGVSVISINAIAAAVGTGTLAAASSANGNSAAPSSGPVAVSASAIVFGAVAHNSTPTLTVAAGLTIVGQVSGGSGSGKRTVTPMFRLASTAGSYSAGGTISSGGQFWQAAVAAFQSPGSSRALLTAPVSMPSTCFDASSTVRSRSPSRSPPDASRAPFPQRSPRRSSANAA
jgi:uncharacterized delta-60 repeat protein